MIDGFLFDDTIELGRRLFNIDADGNVADVRFRLHWILFFHFRLLLFFRFFFFDGDR